ncbi:MAG: hypothetical protein FJZ01_12600 [Candidatus Sericytochromatia bacterium]|nr:hypothetical protein [Candidatus Tanganyikabacteria bacterium]
MTTAYPREVIDAKFEQINAEIGHCATKADVADLRGEMLAGFAGLRGELAGLRGEMKVWLLVLGAVLTVVSSGVGARVFNTLWPAPPATLQGR